MLDKDNLNILYLMVLIQFSEQKIGNSFAYSIDLSSDPTRTLHLHGCRFYNGGCESCEMSEKVIENLFKRYRKTKRKERNAIGINYR